MTKKTCGLRVKGISRDGGLCHVVVSHCSLIVFDG